MTTLLQDLEAAKDALDKLSHYAECQVAAFSSGRPHLDLTLFPSLCRDARANLSRLTARIEEVKQAQPVDVDSLELPRTPDPQTLITEVDVGSRAYTDWQMRDYARAALRMHLEKKQ